MMDDGKVGGVVFPLELGVKRPRAPASTAFRSTNVSTVFDCTTDIVSWPTAISSV